MTSGDNKQCVLITGGAGYIGSHTAIEVIECIRRLGTILGRPIEFHCFDLRCKEKLRSVFRQHDIQHVLHFAGLKAVGESSKIPLDYYSNNMDCTFSLIQVMKEFSVKSLVFSSSATVYGVPEYLPIDENHSVGACTNPYGRTKYFIEKLLEDICMSDTDWCVALLRYFNPAGAHPSGLIGEDPCGPPNNLMPFVAQVAVGRREKLSIFGDDYDTPDGTGVRDYIHVVDLAKGHVSALHRLERYKVEREGGKPRGCFAYNLGTGSGYSVLEMISQFEKSAGIKIASEVVDRRAGDVSSCYADPKLAFRELGWKAEKGLKEMCDDLWRWQSTNPKGFED